KMCWDIQIKGTIRTVAFNHKVVALAISEMDGAVDAKSRIELRQVDDGKAFGVAADPGEVGGQLLCLAATAFCLVGVFESTLIGWDMERGNILYKIDLPGMSLGKEDMGGKSKVERICNIVIGNADAELVLVFECGDIIVVDVVEESCKIYRRSKSDDI